MSEERSEVQDLLGGGGGAPSYPFSKPGDEIRGIVATVKVYNQTYMDDTADHKKGDIMYWPDGKPKRMINVIVQTDQKTAQKYDAQLGTSEAVESEDGRWSISLTGNKFTAAQRVLGSDILEGAVFGMRFDQFSDRKPKSTGHSRAKLYTAFYEEPPKGVNVATGEPTKAATPTNYATSTPQSGNEGILIPNGGRPDYLDQSAWDILSPAEKAELSPPSEVPQGYQKPAGVPQAAWDKMSDQVKAKVVGASAPV